MIWVVCIVGLLKHTRHVEESVIVIFQRHTIFAIGIILFLIAATISIFTSVDMRVAAGEWKAFYIEPFILFLVLYFSRERLESRMDILLPLILSGLATALLAIYQHFTGWMVPWDFWVNNDTFRVTGWYGFPNGVGLFLAPLVIMAVGILWQHFFSKKQVNLVLFISAILLLITGPLAVFYAKSTGGLIGILAGIGIFLLYNRRTRWPSIIIGIIAFTSILNSPNLAGIKNEISLQDRSGQIRVSMWKEAGQLIKDSPLLGAGLSSYDERIKPYHTTVNGEGIEIFHHPHNIFLTMWVNLGLVGLIGFLLILIGFYIKGLRYSPMLIAVMTVIVVTGLVDSPYIKNDLAVLFWVLPLLLLTSTYATMEK
jgi:O-antigen ligase